MSALGKMIPSKKLVREIEAEWDAFVSEHALCDEEGQVIWGEALIRRMGEKGLATLLWLARRGHFESARVLKETFLGLPEQPLAVRISDKTAHETRDLLRAHLIEVMKLTPEVAEGMLERFKRAALEEPEARPALPEPGPVIEGSVVREKRRRKQA